MLDPDLTNILKRRIGASLIDLGVVAVIGTLVWRTQLIAFPITSTDAITGEPLFDTTQLARQAEIAENLNTSFTRGDTLYVLDQSGFVLTTLCVIVMLALVFILIPANFGWSPGKKLMNLAVIDADGNNPPLVSHAIRTAVGIVDVLPIVLPGLVGWVLANTHEYRQRLGDRVARSYVIDNRVGAKFIDPLVYERRRELRRSSSVSVDPEADSDDMVQIGDRLGGSPSGLHRPDPQPGHPPDPAPPPGPGVEPSAGPLAPPPAAIAPAPSAVTRVADTAHDGSLPPLPPLENDEIDLSRLAPPATEPMTTTPPPSEGPAHTAASAAPTPNRRFTVDAHAPTNELGFVEPDQPDLGLRTSTPFDEPAPVRRDEAPTAPLAHAPAPSAGNDLDLDVTAATAPAAVPMPTHRGSAPAEPDWEQPIPEPAPVWEPRAATAPSHATPTDATPAADDTETASEGSAAMTAEGLVWNEQWQAWLFWDAEHEHWLRHDLTSDRWIPIR